MYIYTGFVQGHTGHTKSYLVILFDRSYKKSYFSIFFLKSHTFAIFPEMLILSEIVLVAYIEENNLDLARPVTHKIERDPSPPRLIQFYLVND